MRLRLISTFLLLLSAVVLTAQPLTRVANTSLKMPTTAPVYGYTLENAFPGLTFNEPVAFAVPPGETNRLFILERAGLIIVITNLAAPTRTVFLDLTDRVAANYDFDDSEGLLGLAFHPDYAANRQFFVYYTVHLDGTDATRHDRLSRFEVSPSDTNAGLPGSEVVFLQQRDERPEHNAGSLHFGPDGYLYLSLADEGTQYDLLGNAQKINADFFSAVLRIDVDKRPGSLAPNPHPAIIAPTNYAIPADNPFIGITSFNGSNVNPAQVRTEFWAVGFRNPWRMSFDPVTGWLYLGDVGQNSREEINLITRGGNYGWSYREGTINGPKSSLAPQNFVSRPPIVEYSHGSGLNQGNAVIGGVVYRGGRLTQLTGAYVFADYVSGNIWATRYDGTNATPVERLTGDANISAFGTDPHNGDVLLADFVEGQIKRLSYSSNFTGTPLPPLLSDTGAFSNLLTLTPQAGVVPYDLNVPFWSDGAIKSRWFSLPNTNLTYGFNADSNWSFPTGAVWVKHFELVTNEVTQESTRLETRLLVRTTNGVYGATYRWGGSTTNATLVDQAGFDQNIVIDQGGGLLRTQVWHFPARSECLTCHSSVGGHALGFNTAQLNRDFAYAGGTTNQLTALASAHYFNTPVSNVHSLRALVPATNDAVSREYRVRSYLAANCSQCHQPGGAGGGAWDARITTPTGLAKLIDGALGDDDGDDDARVIEPGSLALSMMHRRLLGDGVQRMPPLATSVLDTNAINLLAAWITNDLVNYQTFSDWQLQRFGSTNGAASAPTADPDGDGASNYLEYLAGSDPLVFGDAWHAGARVTNGAADVLFTHPANRSAEVEFTTNLVAPLVWQFLNVPGNRPFFAASNHEASVRDDSTNSPLRFYRVRLREP